MHKAGLLILFTCAVLFSVHGTSDPSCKRFNQFHGIRFNKSECTTFKTRLNFSIMGCFVLCSQDSCTAIAMESKNKSNWCCLFNSQTITVQEKGTDTLYYSVAVNVTFTKTANLDSSRSFSSMRATCTKGWTGRRCNRCAAHFAPEGACDVCEIGWSGENCDVCHTNSSWNGVYKSVPNARKANTLLLSFYGDD